MNVSTVTMTVWAGWMDRHMDKQQRGSRVQVTIFGCGGIFISYLHSRNCWWCEMTFIISVQHRQKVCMCVHSLLHTQDCACVKVMHNACMCVDKKYDLNKHTESSNFRKCKEKRCQRSQCSSAKWNVAKKHQSTYCQEGHKNVLKKSH